jgi:hypothetical protein
MELIQSRSICQQIQSCLNQTKLSQSKLPVKMKAILSATRALLLFICIAIAGCGNDPAPVPQGEGSLLIYTFLEQHDFDKIELFVDGILKGTLTERVSGTLPCATETSDFAVKIRIMAEMKWEAGPRKILSLKQIPASVWHCNKPGK